MFFILLKEHSVLQSFPAERTAKNTKNVAAGGGEVQG